jgi:L-iditol 2-dehydrogenase
MGHEASGAIAEVGSAVTAWVPGDRVTFDSTIYCGRCWYCVRGEINLCENRRVLGVACDEYRRQGAFAEYVVVPQHVLYRLPDRVSFSQGAIVEPLSIALHAVRRTRICLNDTAVVVGAGMIGLLVIQALRVAGCGRIVAVDLERTRLERACALGADEGLLADHDDVRGTVLKHTANRGADLAFEVVGIASTLATAVACLRKGGQLTLVGNLAAHIAFPLQAVVTREINVNGSCASCGEYPACLDMIARGVVKVDPLISAVAPLADGAAWFKRLQGGADGLMKVILEP